MQWLVTAWDSILVYLLTVIGVLAGQVLPAFKAHQRIDFHFSHGGLIVAVVVALVLVLHDENSGSKRSPAEIKAGKMKNLRRRLSLAFFQGYTWTSVLG